MKKNDVKLQVSAPINLSKLTTLLHSEFSMTDLGLLRQFLGLEIEKNGKGIMPSQPQHALDLLKQFNMAECKASKSPFLSGIKMHEFGNSPMVDITLYMQLVSNLLYLTHTRPDLSYDVSVVERHMHQPHELHWRAAKIILQYVQGTKKFEVQYIASSSLQLAVFSDSDWGGDPIDRKSTSGFVFMFAEGPIFWSSKKQNTISLS